MTRWRGLGAVGLAAAIAACSGGASEPSPLGAGPTLASTTTRPRGNGGGPQSVDIAIGECFDAAAFRAGALVDLESIEPVTCQAPHDDEVYAVLAHSAAPGEDYPGATPLQSYSLDKCLGEFEAYVGAAYERSALDIGAVWPTQDSWGDDDRRIVCFLYDANFDKLDRSMRHSGR